MRALIPGLLITITNVLTMRYCKSIETLSADIPGRPPGWVFGLAWSVLYVTLGLVWQSTKNDLIFGTITALCCAWMILYTCANNKELAAYNLALLALISWKLTYDLKKNDRILMLPFSVWITYALYLNVQSLQLKYS